jgi:8-oxo-dGTP diphosphatase
VLEETGLEVSDLRFLTATNNIMQDEGKHYVTIYLGCKIIGEKKRPEVLMTLPQRLL